MQLVVGQPLINILRGAMAILAATVSHPHGDEQDAGTFGFKALKPIIDEHPQFLEMLVARLSSADHALCVAALQLINALMRDAMVIDLEGEWPHFIQNLKHLGAISAVHNLMQITALQDMAHPLLDFQTLIKIMLRKWRQVEVDLEKQDHRRSLRAIYLAANPDKRDKKEHDAQDSAKKKDLEKWRKLGFQTESPAGDFEHVGYLGLIDLQDFARKDEESFQNLQLEQLTKDPDERCPVARASLAVTCVLYDHFEIDEADTEDQQQYVALESHSNFGRLFKPLLLQWSRLHTAALKAFIRLWSTAGARTEDFTKIENLVRVLVEQVVGFAPRTKETSRVEEEMASHWPLSRLRELQMELMELTHEEAWGRHLRQVKDELHHESLQFMKEQRVRCLLEGSWFPKPSHSEHEELADDGDGLHLPWRFARLSHNRRFLHYDNFSSKKRSGDEPSLDSLHHRLDLSMVSSVVSNRPSSTPRSSTSTVRLSPQVDTGIESEANGDRLSNASIVIHGHIPASSAGLQENGHVKSSKHSRKQSTGTGEEVALLTLHPTSHRLASEWLDGLLLLLGQTPITAETNKLVDFIAKYGLRIRLLNVRFEEVMGSLDGDRAYGKQVEMPSREGVDDEFYYDMPIG